jgi:hypothetical protein
VTPGLLLELAVDPEEESRAALVSADDAPAGS